MATKGEEEFSKLPFREKLEFLYGLPARRKRDLILSVPEAERLVRSFSPETLFYTLKEIGVEDSGELLAMALPEQIQGLFDLDCWNKDRPAFERIRAWFEALAEGGRQRVADAIMGLDIELATLLMRQYVKVYRLEEIQSSLDVPVERLVQFDAHYAVEFIRHDHILPLIQEALEEILERDYDFFSSLMEEIYWGVDAELEEQAYQYRRARLSDRGFPDFFEAQSVFAYLDPARFHEIRSLHVRPAREALNGDFPLDDQGLTLASEAGGDASLLGTALRAGFGPAEQRQVRGEMALVTNQVLVARAVDFGDLEAVRHTVELTHQYLNVGLEYLAGGDIRTAIEYLRDTHLKLIFRLGVSLVLDLRMRTVRLVRSLGFRDGVSEIPYLDSPYREAVTGFLQRLPQFYEGIDRPGAVSMRDFRRIRDLHLAYRILEQVEVMRPLVRAIAGLDIAAPEFRAEVAGRDVRLSQLLLTALVRGVLDGRRSARPIEASRLRAARTAIMEDSNGRGRLHEWFRRDAHATVKSELEPKMAGPGCAFLDFCLNRMEEELAEWERAEKIDPRFVDCLLVAGD